jgi:hypothetical protein
MKFYLDSMIPMVLFRVREGLSSNSYSFLYHQKEPQSLNLLQVGETVSSVQVTSVSLRDLVKIETFEDKVLLLERKGKRVYQYVYQQDQLI